MAEMVAPAPMREVSDPVWRMLTGAAIFCVGVFICGAVGTYVSTDPSWNAATNAPVQNLFGTNGAIFADLARQTLGWSAWGAGFAAMVGGAMRTVLIGTPMRRRWALGVLSIPLSAACFAAWPVPNSWPLATGLGGMAGDALLHFAQLPFEALLLPHPRFFAGIVCGLFALWCALAAMGFQRRDANLLSQAAALEGRRAARRAQGLTGWFKSFFAKREGAGSDRVHVRKADSLAPDNDFRSILRGMNDGPEPDDEDGDWENEEHIDDEANTPDAGRPVLAPQPKPKPTLKSAKPKIRKNKRQKTTKLPPIDLLQLPPERREGIDEEALQEEALRLAEVLKEFGVRGRIREIRPGPVVTLFEMEPAPGVKSSRVINLADDIARSMSAISARVAVVPGKNAIGIELPNKTRDTVYFRSLLASPAYTESKASLPMALGEDIGGTPTVVELAKMPHLLIAGTTGSGKSVGVNAMILSLMYRLPPEQCRFIMIDPKMLELSIYEGIPHLMAPVVTDPKKAVNALKWAVIEMESRYELMSKAGVRNLAGFNEKAAKHRANGTLMSKMVQTGYDDRGKPIHETEDLPLDHIPNIVIVIDEMADLMMVAGKEIEGCIQRLAQMARAAGIHLITATQRPSVDVITGTAIDLGGDHVGNTGWEVRFDRTGNNIDGWTLGR
ncbi:MAG: DNA translocase FtsK 4TM domain-containing protein, partial [Pseudomonadota bacterium]